MKTDKVQTNSNGCEVKMTLDCTFAKHYNQQIIREGADYCEIPQAQAYNFELFDMPTERPDVCGCISAQRAHDCFVVIRKKSNAEFQDK